jgi:hypothetical protein
MKKEKPNYDFSKFESQKIQSCTSTEYVEMERAEPPLRTQRREEAWSHHIKKYDELKELGLDYISKKMETGDEVERHISRFLDKRAISKELDKHPADKVTLLSYFEHLIADWGYYYLNLDCSVQMARLALRDLESGKHVIEDYFDFDSQASSLRTHYWSSFCEVCVFLSGYCDVGIYLYNSPKHSESHIEDSSTKYSLLKEFTKKYGYHYSQYDKTIPPIPSDIDAIFPFDFNQVFVSKSGVAISHTFLPADDACSAHELEISKKAYRTYLENQFVFEKEEERLTEQKKRELILLGWIIGKGFKQGDKVKGYNRKTCWRELEESCPEYFKKSSGEELTNHAMKEFFDGAVEKGICRFR